jgi:hypothetical protein
MKKDEQDKLIFFQSLNLTGAEVLLSNACVNASILLGEWRPDWRQNRTIDNRIQV